MVNVSENKNPHAHGAHMPNALAKRTPRFQLDVHTHITDPDTIEFMRFEKALLTPLFADGTLTEFPGATMYAVCYGMLCAYGPDPEHLEQCDHAKLLAVHTADFPDCQCDLHKGTRHSAFIGHWEL